MEKYVQACTHTLTEVPCSKVMQIGFQKARERILTRVPTASASYDLVEEVSYLQRRRRVYSSLPESHYVYSEHMRGRVPYSYYTADHHLVPPNIRFLQTSHLFKGESNLLQQAKLNPIELFLHFSERFCHEITGHELICGRNIGEIYPVQYSDRPKPCKTPLKSLPQILHDARQKLTHLSFAHKDRKGLGDISSPNCEMLALVNGIIENDLEPCVSMLGGFMEQQIRIPLVNNPKDTVEAFAAAETSGAVGVWALFALGRTDIESILCKRGAQQRFVVQIAEFIQGVLNKAKKPKYLSTSYEGKLQFLLQGLTNTVSCSSHYISYSLERELVRLCRNFDITPKSKVKELTSQWDSKFNKTALALVPSSHRPLVARWIIWALNIYQLREGLAKYITIGIIGLVNSGKSTLVKKLFKKEVSLLFNVINFIFM